MSRGFVHAVTIQRQGVALETDDYGRGGQTDDGAPTQVRARVAHLRSQERVAADQFVSDVSAVCLVDADVEVSAKDQLTASGAGSLDGTWEIATIVATPRHLRLFLRRVPVPSSE